MQAACGAPPGRAARDVERPEAEDREVESVGTKRELEAEELEAMESKYARRRLVVTESRREGCAFTAWRARREVRKAELTKELWKKGLKLMMADEDTRREQVAMPGMQSGDILRNAFTAWKARQEAKIESLIDFEFGETEGDDENLETTAKDGGVLLWHRADGGLIHAFTAREVSQPVGAACLEEGFKEEDSVNSGSELTMVEERSRAADAAAG